MIEKIASYNRVADKGMDLIARIAYMNDMVKTLLLEDNEEVLKQIAIHAKTLEASVLDYQNCLVASIREIASEESDVEIEIIEDESGHYKF